MIRNRVGSRVKKKLFLIDFYIVGSLVLCFKTKTSLVVHQATIGLASNQTPTNRIFHPRSDKKLDAKYHFITIFEQVHRVLGEVLMHKFLVNSDIS